MARTTRTAAERAALAAQREEMQRRAALVGAAADTQERVQTLIAELLAALDDHDTAYRAATAGGWSNIQLREIADIIEDPTGGARRALKRLTPPATTPAEQSPAATARPRPAVSPTEPASTPAPATFANPNTATIPAPAPS